MDHYRLGSLEFTLDGRDPALEPLRDEFRAVECQTSERPALRFRFGRLPSLSDYTRVDPMEAGDGRYRTRAGKLRYLVEHTDDGFDVHLESDLSRPLLKWPPKRVKQFLDWNYLTPEEMVAKDFMYDVFDYLSQIIYLEQGATYLHASSFERDGRGVAAVAWGGIGKTTSMLKLVLEDGWRFLSDDLALLDSDGTLWRTPKKMQIYAYNVSGQEHLRDALLDERSPVDRASWTYRRITNGPKGVRRRVSAEELFGPGRVGSTAELDDVFFLERCDVAGILCEDLDVEELVERAAVILLDELQPYTDLAVALHSTGRMPILPSPSELVSRTEEVLCEALDGLSPRYVRIPLDAGPDELADFFRRELD